MLMAPALMALAVGACGDQGPESGPGTVTATLVGPAPSQGGVEFRLVGQGIQAVRAVNGQLFSRTRGDTVEAALVRETPGELSFSIQLLDTTATPVATVVEVAGADNAILPDPGAWSIRMGGGR